MIRQSQVRERFGDGRNRTYNLLIESRREGVEIKCDRARPIHNLKQRVMRIIVVLLVLECCQI